WAGTAGTPAPRRASARRGAPARAAGPRPAPRGSRTSATRAAAAAAMARGMPAETASGTSRRGSVPVARDASYDGRMQRSIPTRIVLVPLVTLGLSLGLFACAGGRANERAPAAAAARANTAKVAPAPEAGRIA